MNSRVFIFVFLCLIVCKKCHASVFCKDQNDVIQYSCEDTAYCCGTMECCLLENGTTIFSLWYFWTACGMGILIVGVIARMLCKGKQHHVMESRVHDISPHNGWQQAQPQPQSLRHPQTQPQVVVIPVMCNQPSGGQEGPFQMSGPAIPLGTVPIGSHPIPSMRQPRGGHGSQQGRPLAMPRRADPLPGGLAKPLGPAYEQPSMYGPLPPGYVPNS